MVAPHSRVWNNSLYTMLPDPISAFACIGVWGTRLTIYGSGKTVGGMLFADDFVGVSDQRKQLIDVT